MHSKSATGNADNTGQERKKQPNLITISLYKNARHTPAEGVACKQSDGKADIKERENK